MIDTNKKLFRWGPIDAAPLPLAYTMVPSFDMMYDLFGICWPESLVIYDKDKAVWIIENDKVIETSREFTDKIIIPDEQRKRFNHIWDQAVSKLFEVQDKIDKTNLSSINDKELAKIFKEWSQVYLNFWAVGMTGEFPNYALEEKLKTMLKGYFDDERDLNEAFATLATPTQMSFYKEEESDLMSIVLLKDQERDEALKEHVRNYFWIYNNYLESKILDKGYFAEQIKHTTPEDAEEFLKAVKEYKETVNQDKENLINKLTLSKEQVKIINLLDECIIFQDVRKSYNLKADHYLEEFLKEFGKRRNVSVRDLKWLLPGEIEKLADGEDMKNLIEKRKHITTALCDIGSLQINVQNAASKINQQFEKQEFEKSVNLQGTVACTSKNRYFRGIAKIVLSPKDGDKLKEGEILVTTMTTPDYVIHMKRAGAIITDVGGVTCHAAVVSREFGIPCIVGTEYATKVIKDGDILELHNLRGTVKIVSSK